jgi:hypothetical protein
MSWIAIAKRATSEDGDMLCRWVPQPDFMSFYNRGASPPASALFQYPPAPHNAEDDNLKPALSCWLLSWDSSRDGSIAAPSFFRAACPDA